MERHQKNLQIKFSKMLRPNIITFLLEAEEEMNASAQYYNQQSLGLGLDFVEEIEKSLQLIEKNPER